MKKYMESILKKTLIEGKSSKVNQFVLYIYKHKSNFRSLVQIYFAALLFFVIIFGYFLYGKAFIMNENDFLCMLLIMLIIEIFFIIPILSIISYDENQISGK